MALLGVSITGRGLRFRSPLLFTVEDVTPHVQAQCCLLPPFLAAMVTGSSPWDCQPQIDLFSCKLLVVVFIAATEKRLIRRRIKRFFCALGFYSPNIYSAGRFSQLPFACSEYTAVHQNKRIYSPTSVQMVFSAVEPSRQSPASASQDRLSA